MKGTRQGGRSPDTAGVRILTLTVISYLLTACAPFREVPLEPPPPDAETPVPDGPPSVYIIHGDADYLYHDARGNRLHADEEALRQAREAARSAVRGDVFIFHQRTSMMRKLWGSRTGHFEYYRSGRLVERKSYVRSDAGFTGEANVLRRMNTKGRLLKTSRGSPALLAYFGHEIPPLSTEPEGIGENKVSRTRGQLTIPDFTNGLSELAAALNDNTGATSDPQGGAITTSTMADSAKPYALVVLSTCYGGNPAMMRALRPLSDFVVASPAYLHLSYLETRPLANVVFTGATADNRREEARALADSVARASFNRLRWQTMTEVTVAVYDLREAVPPDLPPAAAPPGTSLQNRRTAGAPEQWRDCAQEDATLLTEEAMRGVTLRFQAPRFGAGKNTATRSAWQCPL